MTVEHKPGARARQRVVIIGGGFAGLYAAKQLAKLPVDVILVDRKNHHTFQPLLYQVATATLSPANIAQPLRGILRDCKNVSVLLDEALGFDLANNDVKLKHVQPMHFDYLILATGAAHSYFGNDQWAPYAPGLKTIEDAVEIRRRIFYAFELAERQQIETGSHEPLNFVVVGGGPTGVELAGAIAETCKQCMQNEYRQIDPTKARVMLLEGLPAILGPYPDDLKLSAVKQLKELGVEVLTSTKVIDIKPDAVVTDKETIPTAVTIWAAGVQASRLGKLLEVETDRRGCVMVDEYLNPANYKNVFVCGDLAHVEQNGKQLPGVAPCAMQMGMYAAKSIGNDLKGKVREKFVYSDKGDMATIGRTRAIANLKWPIKTHFTGYIAWLSWLLIHLVSLVGLRNRLIVFLEWLWAYSFNERGVQLITVYEKEPDTDSLE